ncbi:MAG: type II secretion system protein [Bacteroidota bacterium]
MRITIESTSLIKLKRGGTFNLQSLNAFTLIELLITIAIIVMLVTLTTAAVSAGLRRSKSVRCQSNMRQLGFYLTTFVNDNGAFPLFVATAEARKKYPEMRGNWANSIAEADLRAWDFSDSPSIFRCPSVVTKYLHNSGEHPRRNLFYGYNSQGMVSSNQGSFHGLGLRGPMEENEPVRVSDVLNPSKMIAFGDAALGWDQIYEDAIGFLQRTPTASDYRGSTARINNLHNHSLNVYWCDGHTSAESLRRLFEDKDAEALSMWNREGAPAP